MKTIHTVRREIGRAYTRAEKDKRKWRVVAAQFGLTPAMAWRIVNQEYEPKEPHIRARLELPALAPAPVCPKCGDVHVTKRCTKAGTRVRRWRDLPTETLRILLDERTEM